MLGAPSFLQLFREKGGMPQTQELSSQIFFRKNPSGHAGRQLRCGLNQLACICLLRMVA